MCIPPCSLRTSSQIPTGPHNERDVQWVHTIEWTISRPFEIADLSSFSAFVLLLEMVDTVSTVTINGQTALRTSNCFQFYHSDVASHFLEGSNRISLPFHLAQNADKRATIPYFLRSIHSLTVIPNSHT
jgi:beta-galactosidase/beta-glucuronidase